MLYSIELWSQFGGRQATSLFFSSVDFLADACLLTGEVSEVEDACATHFTVLVNLNAVNERGLEGENPFYTHAACHFTNCEGLGEGVHATYLENHSAELLKSLFVAFLDPVGNGDGVTGLECRIGSALVLRECLLYNLDVIHNSQKSISSATLLNKLKPKNSKRLLFVDCKGIHFFLFVKLFSKFFEKILVVAAEVRAETFASLHILDRPALVAVEFLGDPDHHLHE